MDEVRIENTNHRHSKVGKEQKRETRRVMERRGEERRGEERRGEERRGEERRGEERRGEERRGEERRGEERRGEERRGEERRGEERRGEERRGEERRGEERRGEERRGEERRGESLIILFVSICFLPTNQLLDNNDKQLSRFHCTQIISTIISIDRNLYLLRGLAILTNLVTAGEQSPGREATRYPSSTRNRSV